MEKTNLILLNYRSEDNVIKEQLVATLFYKNIILNIRSTNKTPKFDLSNYLSFTKLTFKIMQQRCNRNVFKIKYHC